MIIKFKKEYKNVELPAYATVGSAGFDLIANNFKEYHVSYHDNSNLVGKSNTKLEEVTSIRVYPGDRVLIGTGFSVAIPKGYIMDIRSRSGNSLNKGLIVANSPGTIDSDYRGEVGVILINHSKVVNNINLGDKIAQGLIFKFEVALFKEVSKLEKTIRGDGGYGSTDGLKKVMKKATNVW